MNDLAISFIFEYISEKYPEDNYRSRDVDFQKRTYSRWILYELIQNVMDKPFQSAEDTLEELIIFTGWYALIAKDEKVRKLFFTATDTLNNLLSDYITTFSKDLGYA